LAKNTRLAMKLTAAEKIPAIKTRKGRTNGQWQPVLYLWYSNFVSKSR
jgi:hypothetical protein